MRQEYTISIKGLVKNYGSIRAVNHLSLEIFPNEVFGFLGPNGAGKTTTISIICGLVQADGGEVAIQRRDGTFVSPEHPPLIGLCPQEPIVWDYLTCEEQLRLMTRLYNLEPKKAKESVQQLLNKLGLMEKKKKTARTLSGGLKRRLNLALAVVHDPEIIILDEPDAGLDPQSRILVREFIRLLAKDRTVIFTTHNMDEADRICDRIAIIDYGRLLVVDTPENLKSQSAQGSVIEVVLGERGVLGLEERIRSTFKESVKDISMVDDRLIIRLVGAERHLSEVVDIFTENGIRQQDIRFRWTTLEDVFINLTGRSLRE